MTEETPEAIILQILEENQKRIENLNRRHQEELYRVRKETYEKAEQELGQKFQEEKEEAIRRAKAESSNDEELRNTLSRLEDEMMKSAILQSRIDQLEKEKQELEKSKDDLLKIIQDQVSQEDRKPEETEGEDEDEANDEHTIPQSPAVFDPFQTHLIRSVGESGGISVTESMIFDNPSFPEKLPTPSENPEETQDYRVLRYNFEDFKVATKNFRKELHLYKAIDLHVVAVSSRPKPSEMSTLVRNLFGTKITSEEGKAYAIYNWIVRNIRYRDVPGLSRNKEANESYLSGFAICGGFANLFNAMCSLAKLDSRYIAGFSKDLNDIPGSVFPPQSTHGWNLVKIDGRWFHVDCSHGSCVSSSKDNSTFEALNDFYFCPDPKQIIFDHWSEHYQFLENKLTKKEWESMVSVDVFGFQRNLRKISQKRAIVALKDTNNWKLSFRCLHGMFVQANVFREREEKEGSTIHLEKISNCYYVQVVDGECKFYFSFPFGKSKYTVSIGLGPVSYTSSRYRSILKYRVHVLKDTKRVFCYPARIYPIGLSNECQLLEGRELVRGKENLVKVKVPYCHDAFLQLNTKKGKKEQIEMVTYGEGIFQAKKVIPMDIQRVTIYGKWSSGNNYSGLYQFEKFS